MQPFSSLAIIVFGMLVNLNSHAANAGECLATLRSGMLAQTLEDVCGFGGGLKEKIKESYTNADCRSIVPQSDVEKNINEVLQVIRADYAKNGEKLFCSNNKKWYFSVLNSAKPEKEEASGLNNVEHALYMAVLDDNLQPTNTYKNKNECEVNGQKAVLKFREMFEMQGAASSAKRVKYKCEPLLK